MIAIPGRAAGAVLSEPYPGHKSHAYSPGPPCGGACRDADARAQRLDAGYSVAIGFRYLRAASVFAVSVSVVFLLVTVSVFTVST